MTDGDRFQFAESFSRLAVALRLPATKAPDALKTQMRVYFEALRDLPFPAVEESVTVLQRQGSGFFPSTQEWYRVADDLAYRTLLDAEHHARPDASWCADCDDTGWLSHACRDGDRCDQHADVDTAWGEHEHVSRCGCRAMNPTIQRRLSLARRK